MTVLDVFSQKTKRRGFTIVELLIVIVVIAILAAITIVAYNGIQARARDSQRESDINVITKALELYYIDNGEFPASGGSTTINGQWSTTADASWSTVSNQLVPKYVAKLPSDPISKPNAAAISGNPNYDYVRFNNAADCAGKPKQSYLLAYHYDASAQKNRLIGECPSGAIGPYGPASNYRVVK